MRKILSLCLVILLLVHSTVPVFSIEAGDDSLQKTPTIEDLLTTNEDAIPHLSNAEVLAYSQTVSTLRTPARSEWAVATTVILENAYRQEVVSVSETADFIEFTFEEPEDIRNNVGYISKVVYTKPESRAQASDYETKITYMYGWMDGYYSLEDNVGKWETVQDILLTVAGYIPKLSVFTFVTDILGISTSILKDTDKVHAANTTQYYVLNKIGQVKNEVTGLWQQWAYVGSRRSFYRTIFEIEDYPGHWDTLGWEETEPNNYANPTNADKVEKKANFDNNTWIINKAISCYEYDQVYRNIYGWTIYFSDTIPG